MKAGRELDALVAEKVFGLEVAVHKYVWSDDDWVWSDYPTETNAPGITNPDFRAGGPTPPAWCIAEYSTSIADAWLVVEEMKSDKIGFSLEDHPESWEAEFGTYFVIADTAPLAICLAALRALGHDV